MVNLLMTAEFRSFTLFVPGLIRLKVGSQLLSDARTMMAMMMVSVVSVLLTYQDRLLSCPHTDS